MGNKREEDVIICPCNRGVELIPNDSVNNTKGFPAMHIRKCTAQRCKTCGWNPEEAKRRMIDRFGEDKAAEFVAQSWALSWQNPINKEKKNGEPLRKVKSREG